MKLKHLFYAMLLLFSAVVAGCGSSGGEGLNGSIEVEAEATGNVVTATATYTHPTETNLIGVPIAFSVQIGTESYDLGVVHTNNSGSVGITFNVPAFTGTQTVTVGARTDNLTDYDSFTMTGRTLTVTPPPALNLTTTAATGTAVPFSIDALPAIATVTDPFGNDLANHPVVITATVSSTNPSDSFPVRSFNTVTGTSGQAPFPGAQGTLIVPPLGGVESMTITWTVTDTRTNQTGSAITTVRLTKTS